MRTSIVGSDPSVWSRAEKDRLPFPWMFALVVMLSILLPYAAAALLAGEGRVFGGFLLNPLDGASYLAKMRQGWEGAWRFTLPFTAQPGEGGYLFLYYLFLGRLARWLGLPLIIMFHLARVGGAGLLLAALLHLLRQVFPGRPALHRSGLWLAGLGSGMGWLLLSSGSPPMDLWVAEAYPFLSMYTNPHFPLGLALVTWCLSSLLVPEGRRLNFQRAAAGLLLSVVLPFGLVTVMVSAGAWVLWTLLVEGRSQPEPPRENWRLRLRGLVALGVLGGPFLLYQYAVTLRDPVLAGWNAQNLTSSPPAWEVLLSLSPALPLALLGLAAAKRADSRPLRPPVRLLAAWMGVSLALSAAPFALQRRFLLGVYLPAAVLAVLGLDALQIQWPSLRRWGLPVLLALALPSNLLVLLMGLGSAWTRPPQLFLLREEVQALEWIDQNAAKDALVLASPEMGAWIPGWTGRRIIYGHPFETVPAAQEEAWVRAAYQGTVSVEEMRRRGVDLVFLGPREQAIPASLDLSPLQPVFRAGSVRLYQVAAQ